MFKKWKKSKQEKEAELESLQRQIRDAGETLNQTKNQLVEINEQVKTGQKIINTKADLNRLEQRISVKKDAYKALCGKFSDVEKQFDDNLASKFDDVFTSQFANLSNARVLAKVKGLEEEIKRLERWNSATVENVNFVWPGKQSHIDKTMRHAKKAIVVYYKFLVKDAVSKMTCRNGEAKLTFIGTTAVDRANGLGAFCEVHLCQEYVDVMVEMAEALYQDMVNRAEEKERLAEERRSEREQLRLEKDAQKAAAEQQRLQAIVDAARAKGDERIAELEAQLAEACPSSNGLRQMAF